MTKILVTGSSGHLGEALVRTLRSLNRDVVGADIVKGHYTDRIGSIADRDFVKECMKDVEVVFHAATLHKPHIATHSRQDFIDTNITGTLNLLEESVQSKTRAFIYTSTTSVFGDALVPPRGAPAAWVTEDVVPTPKNIYGATKSAAEDLCQLFHRNQGLPCIILRTSRFFPEDDDNKSIRSEYSSENAKLNEFTHRRVSIDDVVSAHLLAAERASKIGFRKYIVSATTPFKTDDLADLRKDAEIVVQRRVPEYSAEYKRRGWKMFPTIDRVYVNDRIRNELGWDPKYDFPSLIARLKSGNSLESDLAKAIGKKGYHVEKFADEPYPTESLI